MGKLTIECETGKVSDGYHTFDELYDHRCMLFMLLMVQNHTRAWRSRLHSDGTRFDGWFVAGMQVPNAYGMRQVTYHIPEKYWEYLDGKGIQTMDSSPEWDGHTSQDVFDRLFSWLRHSWKDKRVE